jgi:hypothetical protein
VAGEGGHAREHFIHGFECLVGVVDTTMIEQQPQRGQLHALCGQRLIDLMGQRCRHLPKCGKLGRLHQAVLRGLQVAGSLFHKLFKFFATALAQFGQAPALVEKQQQKHQCQPEPGSREGSVAAVFEGDLRATQQVQASSLRRPAARIPINTRRCRPGH